MNKSLQGLGENVLTSGDKILGFKGKLSLWKIILQKTNKQKKKKPPYKILKHFHSSLGIRMWKETNNTHLLPKDGKRYSTKLTAFNFPLPRLNGCDPFAEPSAQSENRIPREDKDVRGLQLLHSS